MALRLVEGWESYGTSTSGAIISDEKWARGGSIGTTRCPGRDSGVALQLSGGSELVTQVQLFDPEPQTIIVGFALKIIDSTIAQPVFEARINSNERTRITVNTDRTLSISQGSSTALATGSTVLALDTWYYIELKTFVAETGNGAGDGTYDLRINGVTEVSGTGPLVPSGRNGVNLIVFSSGGTYGVTALQIDDIYVCDDQGSINNDFLGDVKVAEIFPNGDESTSWTTSAGTDHFSLVADNPRDDDVTYVETSSNGSDIFNYESFPGTGTILGIQVNSLMKGTGPAEVRNVVKSGSTTDDTTSPLFSFHTNTWIDYWSIHELDPDTGSAWNDSGINAAAFGVKQSSGSPRLTKQWVQILYAAADAAIEEDVDSEIVFEQTLLVAGPVTLEIESELAIEHDVAVAGPIYEDIESEITFSDELIRIHEEELESELTLIDEALANQFVYARFLPEGMYDDGVFDINRLPAFSDDLLHLVQTVATAGTRSLTAASVMTIGQSVSVTQSVINRSIQSIISFSDRVGLIRDLTASSVILFDQQIERTYFEESILALSSEVEAYVGHNAESELSFFEELTLNFIGTRFLEDELNLNQSLMIFMDRLAQHCTYSPQVGFASSGITPPSVTQPQLGRNVLTLSYPFGAPSTEVTLRNPQFGNTNRLNFMRIKTTTRGGTLLVFADPQWPKEQTFSLQIAGLSKTQVDDLQTFLKLTLGKEIGLVDHESRRWKGFITTPNMDVTQIGRHAYSVNFEFEGVWDEFLPI